MYGCVYVTRYDVYLFRVPGVASHTKIYIYKIKTIYFISTALYFCYYVPFLIFGNGNNGLDKILYNYLLWDFSYSYAIPILYSLAYIRREKSVCLLLLNFEFDRTTERIREFV